MKECFKRVDVRNDGTIDAVWVRMLIDVEDLVEKEGEQTIIPFDMIGIIKWPNGDIHMRTDHDEHGKFWMGYEKYKEYKFENTHITEEEFIKIRTAMELLTNSILNNDGTTITLSV